MFPRYQSRQIKPRFEWHPRIDPSHPLSIGLVGFWLFNETGGLTAYDLSNQGSHGTLTGATHVPAWTPGRSGQALSFDGVDDYVSIGTSANLVEWGPMTVSARIKANTFPSSNWDNIVSAWNASGYAFNLRVDQWPRPSFCARNSSADKSIYVWYGSGIYINSKDWFHITGTMENGTLNFYLNGAYVGSGSYDGWSSSNTGIPAAIGGDVDAYFDGLIDEVRIYKRALSAQEISWLYEFPYDNLIVESTRKFWLIPEVAVGALSINVYDSAGVTESLD